MKRLLIKPVAPVHRTTQCSSFDYLVRTMTPAMAFCYDERLDTARLSQALGQILCDYGLFAGRLSHVQGTWTITHGVAGVRFEITERTESASELGSAAASKHSKIVCPRISASGALGGKEPLFAARVTHTPDGSVLGVTWHHMLGDMHSMMLLLRAWAQAYRGEPYEKPLDVPDRDAYLNGALPPAMGDQDLVRLLSWSEIARLLSYLVGSRIRRLNLDFSWDDIARIHATAALGSYGTQHDALCAHLIATIRRLQPTGADARLAVSINYRKRVGLPANLLGNIIDTVATTVANGDDTHSIASGLRAGIIGFRNGPIAQRGMMKFKATQPSRAARERCVPSDFDSRPGNLTVTSWANFGVYDLRFEPKPPVFVHCGPQELGPWCALVVESPRQEGLTVRLWLPPKLAELVAIEHRVAQTTVRAQGAAALAANGIVTGQARAEPRA